MDIAKEVLAKIEAIFKLIIDFIKGFMPEKDAPETDAEEA